MLSFQFRVIVKGELAPVLVLVVAFSVSISVSASVYITVFTL